MAARVALELVAQLLDLLKMLNESLWNHEDRDGNWFSRTHEEFVYTQRAAKARNECQRLFVQWNKVKLTGSSRMSPAKFQLNCVVLAAYSCACGFEFTSWDPSVPSKRQKNAVSYRGSNHCICEVRCRCIRRDLLQINSHKSQSENIFEKCSDEWT